MDTKSFEGYSVSITKGDVGVGTKYFIVLSRKNKKLGGLTVNKRYTVLTTSAGYQFVLYQEDDIQIINDDNGNRVSIAALPADASFESIIKKHISDLENGAEELVIWDGFMDYAFVNENYGRKCAFKAIVGFNLSLGGWVLYSPTKFAVLWEDAPDEFLRNTYRSGKEIVVSVRGRLREHELFYEFNLRKSSAAGLNPLAPAAAARIVPTGICFESSVFLMGFQPLTEFPPDPILSGKYLK